MNDSNLVKIYTAADLKALPQREWLIQGVLQSNGLGFLYGPPKSGKTFVALDWAAHIVTGRSWCGRDVVRGNVLYVASEGGFGIRQRIDAYEQERQVALTGSFYVLDRIPLLESRRVEDFAEQVATTLKDVKLIVFDTFARCFNGDENSAREVGQAIQALDGVRTKTGASILVLHHSSKSGEGYRGSSALEGAADTMVAVELKGKRKFDLDNTKQKNGPEFDSLSFRLKDVRLAGEETSCIVEQIPHDGRSRLADGPKTALEVLRRRVADLGRGLTPGEWQKALSDRLGKPVADGTFRHWRDKLRDLGLVEATSNYWVEVATATDLPNSDQVIVAPSQSAATTTPPLGGVGGTDEACHAGFALIPATTNATLVASLGSQ